MIKPMDKESLLILMEQSILVNEKRINNMDMESKFGRMGLIIQDIIFKGRSMEKANLYGMMAVNLKEILLIII